jgi:hypothetical protein
MKTTTYIFGILLLGVLMQPNQAAAQTKYTNQTADMRKGPAAYHEFLLRLYINNQVKLDSSQGYWDRVLFRKTLGWVPSYTLSDTKLDADKLRSDSLQSRMSLMFSQIDNSGEADKNDLVATPAQVSAAVKGFAEKWRKARDIEYNVDLERYLIEPPSPTEFENFIGVRTRKLTNNQKRKLLYPEAIFVPYTDPAVDQVGYAVASAVAQKGLVRNYPLQRYLDLLSALIVENSQKPELDFSVFILDVDEVAGYSLPGNYVFISKGALRQMRSEAELVHFLSHEIAHLVFSHGMDEYHEQEPRIKREGLLDEMRAKLAEDDAKDQATDEERENEQRLTDMSDEFFDGANSKRLDKYELDADRWGVIYTYLSGYNPTEAINFLKRIQGNEADSIAEWTGVSSERRIVAISKQIKRLNLATGNTSSDLFNRLMSSLDD